MKTPEKEKFNPQAFLNARIISPLEQEKLVGGNVAEEDEADSEKKKVKEKSADLIETVRIGTDMCRWAML